MWHTIICDGNELEQGQLLSLTRQCLADYQIEAQITGCATWQELDALIRHTPPDVIIIAQDGVEGLNTITSARLLSRKLIWLSDLDFGVQAYRLCVPYFSKKPISYQIMQQALATFMQHS